MRERKHLPFVKNMKSYLEIAFLSCNEHFVSSEAFGCLLMFENMMFCSKNNEDRMQYLEINFEDCMSKGKQIILSLAFSLTPLLFLLDSGDKSN